MAAAMVTAFVTTFMSSALNLSIPALESYFHVSAATVSWVVSTYTMAVAAMSLPFGKLADAAGMKKVFLTGIAGFGILSLVSPFSANIGFLLICRTLQGACGAMMFATNNSILIKAHPGESTGPVSCGNVRRPYPGPCSRRSSKQNSGMEGDFHSFCRNSRCGIFCKYERCAG